MRFDGARKDAINATLSNAVPIVLTTAVAIVISTFILGVVTHTLARQLGGDGTWQPTVGLSMLIMSITDTPRLIVAMFFGGDASFVQLLGWATWVAAGALLTLMVSKFHDLRGRRRLATSAIQLIAILSIIKLGTLARTRGTPRTYEKAPTNHCRGPYLHALGDRVAVRGRAAADVCLRGRAGRCGSIVGRSRRRPEAAGERLRRP